MGGANVNNYGSVELEINNVNYNFIIVDKISNNSNLLIGWPCLVKNNFSISCHEGTCQVSFGKIISKVVSNENKNININNTQLKPQK